MGCVVSVFLGNRDAQPTIMIIFLREDPPTLWTSWKMSFGTYICRIKFIYLNKPQQVQVLDSFHKDLWLHDDISNKDISNEDISNEDISNEDWSNKDISKIDISNENILNIDISKVRLG
jgi:hypothetical protein